MKNWKKGSKGYILFLIRKRKINIWLRVGKQDKKRKYRSIFVRRSYGEGVFR